ncbi:MAG: Hsp70 family protein, partial [Planctomycetota bacterium]
LSKDEVERMRKEAEQNAAADKVRRELVDLRNQGEAAAYSTRKALEEHGGKVSAEARGTIEAALSNLETALKGDDKAAINAALKTLNDASAELGKAVYEASSKGAAGGAENAGAKPASKDDVIDAEYEVKDGN